MRDGFANPPADVLGVMGVTFMIAQQTEMAIERWGPRLRLAMARARLTIPARVDNFTHTQALIDLGRSAGDRLLTEHLDSSFRVRPGILEVTLPDTVSRPVVVGGSPVELPSDETLIETEPSARW
jgi:hypothetical protein